jgi:hypothetical protein
VRLIATKSTSRTRSRDREHAAGGSAQPNAGAELGVGKDLADVGSELRRDGERQTVQLLEVQKRDRALERIGDFAPERSTQRDTVFKSLLTIADLCAAAVGLGLAALIAGQRVVAASVATLPLIVLILKVGGATTTTRW